MNTPHNTNPMILKQKIKEISGGGAADFGIVGAYYDPNKTYPSFNLGNGDWYKISDSIPYFPVANDDTLPLLFYFKWEQAVADEYWGLSTARMAEVSYSNGVAAIYHNSTTFANAISVEAAEEVFGDASKAGLYVWGSWADNYCVGLAWLTK
jgi:hypothetical protein